MAKKLNLCFVLVKPLMERRFKVDDLTKNLERFIHEMLGKEVCKPAIIAIPTKSHRRCAGCVNSLAKGSGYK